MADFGDREMILANFQAVTAIDNLDECIEWLNQNDWDLMSSVNSVFANESEVCQDTTEFLSDSLSSKSVQIQAKPDVIVPSLDYPVLESGLSVPSSSKTHAVYETNNVESEKTGERVLRFSIKWKDGVFPVTLNDSCSVGMLKQEIEKRTGVPRKHHELVQWPQNISVTDKTILSHLNLEDETTLLWTPTLTTNLDETSSQTSSTFTNGITKSLRHPTSSDVKLRIRYLNKRYDLNLSGTKTIGEVKTDMSHRTDVEPRHQEWIGWPEKTTNDTKLAELNKSSVGLILKRRLNQRGRSSPMRQASPQRERVVQVDSDEDDDKMDISEDNRSSCSDESLEGNLDVDDDIIIEEISTSKTVKELIPAHSRDTRETLETFVNNFEERYGHCHPHFYIGSFNDVLEEATMKNAKDRWPLLLYLHHDSSILTNVFCSQILCDENIVSYVSENFLCWAWDVSHDTNKTLLYDIVTQKIGSSVASTVRRFKADQYPLVVVIMKNRSSLEVSAVLQGVITVNEVMTTLLNARELFEESQRADMREEQERDAREAVKREQDEAYQESLRVDRAKEEERTRQENEALRVKKETEEKAFLEAQTKQAQINSLEEHVPEEPGPDCLEPISILRFRMPDNETITRRFLASSPLKVVLIFVQSKGYLEEQYAVVTNFPRKQLSNLDPDKSLQSLGLYPQETLFVEEI
ncbi:FAS-associated factor 1-like [Xenia sp. Carnegie-2017]|uniref:FAS-associated factor 1-like n=1 Tax=Xenia sp. Carnegie-2017 TaxID=2897299 RepID=UPI001F042AC9|nr:FAS-associated factor 1-like [Xenia sp. Carnegie-2017]